MNTSLTESFGIAIVEAACAGLYVVSTRVGGVPEILPSDMISFANPDEDGAQYIELFPRTLGDVTSVLFADVIRAMSEAIRIVQAGGHDPHQAHQRVRGFYDWSEVADRVEKVYSNVLRTPPYDFWTRMQR